MVSRFNFIKYQFELDLKCFRIKNIDVVVFCWCCMLHLFSLINDWKNKGCLISHILVGLSIDTFSVKLKSPLAKINYCTNKNKNQQITIVSSFMRRLQQLSIWKIKKRNNQRHSSFFVKTTEINSFLLLVVFEFYFLFNFVFVFTFLFMCES